MDSFSVVIFLTVIIIIGTCIATRYASGLLELDANKYQSNLLGCWIPYLGHALDIFLWPDWLIREGFKKALSGVYLLYILGRKHYVLCSLDDFPEDFTDGVLAKDQSRKHMISGVSKCNDKIVAQIDAILLQLYSDSESSYQIFHTYTMEGLCRDLPTLVTGCASRIDQMPWEKDADADITDDRKSPEHAATECNLFPLLSSFMTQMMLQPMLGPQVPAELPGRMAHMNASSFLIALGAPRWPAFILPLSSIHTAYRARRDALDTMTSLDDEFSQRDDHSLFSTLCSPLRELCTSRMERVRADFAIVWTLTKDVGPLAFWVLLHILTSSETLREAGITEAKALAKVEEPPPIIPGSSIREPPEVSIDNLALVDEAKCPILHAHFLECVRVYAKPWSTFEAKSDTVLPLRASKRVSVSTGDFVDIAWESCLSVKNRTIFEDRGGYDAGRFLDTDEGSEKENHRKMKRAFEMSSQLQCLQVQKPFILATVACTLATYHIKPPFNSRANDQDKARSSRWAGFDIPKWKRTANVAIPVDPVRVQLTRTTKR